MHFYLFTAIIFLNLSVFATWQGEVKIQNARMLYGSVAVTPKEVIFEQTTASIMVEKTINNKKEVSDQNEVPGIETQGHSRLIFYKHSEKDITIRVDKLSVEHNVKNPLDYEARAYFEIGSWTDFIAKKMVKIQLTPQGLAETILAVQGYMKKTIEIEAKQKAILFTPNVEITNFDLIMSPLSGNLQRLFQRIDNILEFQVSIFNR